MADDPPAGSPGANDSPTPVSQPPEMTNIDIAADGDVIVIIEQVRLKVSSVILSSASPVFKAIFGPSFLEGQEVRSAQHPKEVTLHEDNGKAMTRLCRLLHHQRDPVHLSLPEMPVAQGAEELFDLALAADKYGCTGSVSMVGGYLLSYFGSASVPKMQRSMKSLLNLIATAYIFEDSRYFALFTRRLVLDHTDAYSAVAAHPALPVLPAFFLLAVEEQRKSAWMSLRAGIPGLAEQRCHRHGCGRQGTDIAFATKLARAAIPVGAHMPFWPPYSDYESLRSVLRQTRTCGDVAIKLITNCNHENDYDHKVLSGSINALCDTVNRLARGLCLTCLGEYDEDGDPVHCNHSELLQWISDDPIL